MTTTQTMSEKHEQSEKGRTLSGVVVSAKMKDTIVVTVVRFVKHPKYHKFIKRAKKYHVHDPGNTTKEGDKVDITECRPISRTKHFVVIQGTK
jgi:small subunit ribosomal protein S17